MSRPADLTVLLTASAPFAGLADSSSEAVARSLDGRSLSLGRLVVEILPVDYELIPVRIDALVHRWQPDIVLGLGVELGSPVIRLETTALNEADFAIADNSGRLVAGGPAFPGDVAARRSDWPARDLVAGLRKRGVPATLSHFAGTHLCNLTLYASLRAIAAGQRRSLCGFVHLPLLPQQVAELLLKREGVAERAPVPAAALASMAFDLQRESVEWILRQLVERVATAESSATGLATST